MPQRPASVAGRIFFQYAFQYENSLGAHVAVHKHAEVLGEDHLGQGAYQLAVTREPYRIPLRVL